MQATCVPSKPQDVFPFTQEITCQINRHQWTCCILSAPADYSAGRYLVSENLPAQQSFNLSVNLDGCHNCMPTGLGYFEIRLLFDIMK